MPQRSPPPEAAESVAWIGPASGPELRWAHDAVAGLAPTIDFRDPTHAVAAGSGAPWPAIVLLGSDVAGRWTLAQLTAVSRRWPLAPLVSVATSLVAGRRRSGPSLPGVEELPWNEAPARLRCWLADRRAGRAGSLGLPATARREDRALEAVAALRQTGRPTARVSIAAGRQTELEGIADLVAAAGRSIVRRTCGRPPLDEPADVLVWDTDPLGPPHLAWLRMLVANRPGLAVVVVDSFPTPDTALVALQAGATAVLGRPLSPEALAGVLLAVDAGASGLGPAQGGR